MQIIFQILNLVITIVGGILRFLFELLEDIFSSVPDKKEKYTAEFVSQGTLLSRWHDGFCLTGRRNLSVKDSYQNALIVGGTGTGKTSVVLIPSIYTMNGSLVINDPSGELFTKAVGQLSQRGFEVKTLNFANPQYSCGYNPLARANSSSDIQKVSSMLVENALGKNTKDPFWTTQATALITMLISILKTQSKAYRNLYNVRQLLNYLGGKPEAIDRLFCDFASDSLYSEYRSFIAYDDKVVSGSIATAKAALQIFNDEAVAKVTSFDTINWEQFRTEKTALFIQNSVADQRYYSVLTSLFFEQFFSYIMSKFPKKTEQDVFFLIDEASSLKLPTLPLAVANVRKHRSGIMLVVQDFNQLVHNYGKYEADGIKANCFAKLYFTGQSLETSKELEQTLGKFEFEDEKDKRKIIRPLMTNDEIRTMRTTRALLICGHHSPIMAELKPYYSSWKFKGFGELNTPALHTQVPMVNIPVLPLPVPEAKVA